MVAAVAVAADDCSVRSYDSSISDVGDALMRVVAYSYSLGNHYVTYDQMPLPVIVATDVTLSR